MAAPNIESRKNPTTLGGNVDGIEIGRPGTKVSFFGSEAAEQPMDVEVTAAAIHQALVDLGLFGVSPAPPAPPPPAPPPPEGDEEAPAEGEEPAAPAAP